jgi:hypothetical protein
MWRRGYEPPWSLCVYLELFRMTNLRYFDEKDNVPDFGLRSAEAVVPNSRGARGQTVA